MKDLKKSAAETFAANPHLESVKVTSDGQCWTKDHEAEQHTRTIGSTQEARQIVTINRDEVESEIAALTKKPKATVGASSEKEIGKMNKEELQAKCTALEIEFDENDTKAELIAKIEEKQKSA